MRNPNEYKKNVKTVAIWRNIRLSVIGNDIRGATAITLCSSCNVCCIQALMLYWFHCLVRYWPTTWAHMRLRFAQIYPTEVITSFFIALIHSYYTWEERQSTTTTNCATKSRFLWCDAQPSSQRLPNFVIINYISFNDWYCELLELGNNVRNAHCPLRSTVCRYSVKLMIVENMPNGNEIISGGEAIYVLFSVDQCGTYSPDTLSSVLFRWAKTTIKLAWRGRRNVMLNLSAHMWDSQNAFQYFC